MDSRSRATEWPQVEPAFGRDLLPALRHQRGLIGPEPAGDLQDLRAGGELDVEHPHCGPHPLEVVILDVAPVLPQVRGDAVRARRPRRARAASTGSGSSVRRACRTVAT